MEKRVTINLNDFSKAKRFTEEAIKFESDIDVLRGRYIIDAKSTLGIFTIDLSTPVDVEINSENESEIKKFKEIMEEFR
mgnify:CR=1 FL=1